MARVSAIESGSPTPTACERTRLTCSSRIWSPGDAHVAQFAHAGRDRVRDFVAGDNLVDDGARLIHNFARIGDSNTARALHGRNFAHRFQR